MIPIPAIWKASLSTLRFRLLLLGGLLFFMASVKTITHAIALVDHFPGRLLHDPIHYLLPAPLDFSQLIFFLTYASVLLVVWDSFRFSPTRFVQLFWVMGAMKFLRSISIFLIPLEPPQGIVPLVDPLVLSLTPNHIVALRDLFFSGHTATVVLFSLLAVSPRIKRFALLVAMVVPLLILWQRVHYTIDVLGGIMVAFWIFHGVEKWMNYFLKAEAPVLHSAQRVRLKVRSETLLSKRDRG